MPQLLNTRLIAIWALLLFAVKLYLANLLGLYHDEAFYWQCSQQLSLAYADHPFMTALLVRAGVELLGDSTIGVRLFFLFMGCTFPYGVYLLARSRGNHSQAVVAAFFSLLMPFTATLGLIAMPDVPLLFFAVFGLVAFERATRTNNLSAWLAAGLLAALGLSTHYRFILFPAAAFIYFVATPHGRSQWGKGGFWLAIIIMLCGLLPVLLFNLGNQFEALNYQFGERQAWVFQTKGLRHPLEQMLVVTPLLYIALISAFILGVRKALKGDDRAALLVIFAGVPLATYLFLAPFSDRQHIFFHWPTLGYIPLFALLPELIEPLQGKLPAAKFKIVTLLAILIAAITSLGLLAGVSASASDRLLKLSPPGSLAYELTGWDALYKKTEQLLAQQPENSLLVIDRYFVDAEIDFLQQGKAPIYLLDHPKNSEHGRAFQYRLWDRDEIALKREKGKRVLILLQESDSAKSYQFGQTKQLCQLFDQLTSLDRLDLFDGEKRYQFFSGIVKPDDSREKCPSLPSVGYLGKPHKIKGKEGYYQIDGWVFNDASSVRLVEIFLDGEVVGNANYGISQPSSQKQYPGSSDPSQPNIGFTFQLEVTDKTTKRHQISVRVTSKNGNITRLKPRHFKST